MSPFFYVIKSRGNSSIFSLHFVCCFLLMDKINTFFMIFSFIIVLMLSRLINKRKIIKIIMTKRIHLFFLYKFYYYFLYLFNDPNNKQFYQTYIHYYSWQQMSITQAESTNNKKMAKDTYSFKINDLNMLALNLHNNNQFQRNTHSSQYRHTVLMKRYKHNKMPLQNKPIQSQFEICLEVQPLKTEIFQNNAIRTQESFNKMMPSSNSMWVNNSKKLQNKWNTTEKRQGKRPKNMKKNVKKDVPFFVGMSHQVLASDDKEYFNSMRNYLSNYKKKLQNERKIRMQSTPKNIIKEKDSLHIIKLCPFTKQKQFTKKISTKDHKETIPKILDSASQVSSPHHHASSSPTTNRYKLTSSSARNQNFQKMQNRIFKTKVKYEQYYNIFGKITLFISDQEHQRFRNLYYRDFIWKICFNRGFLYQNSGEIFRYYVGKGNNSRLIKRIMKTRPWWVEQSKQQNAHFIWTQLKVYQIYKNQKSIKADPNNSESLLQTTQKNNTQTIEASNQDKNKYILNNIKYKKWRQYIIKKSCTEKNVYEDMRQRKSLCQLAYKPNNDKITNHLQYSRVIGNKKALYKTLTTYFNYKQKEGYLPMTFHITGGLEDEEYLRFLRQFYKRNKEGSNHWIVKPGELSNRGRHIKYCRNLKQIKNEIKQKKTNNNGSYRTYIVQSYLQKPFLYQNRKFDLRHYIMITSTQGKIRGYFYQQGYVRTTSYPYSLQSYQPSIHLTNDAVQKYLPHYGKYEQANKLSYSQLNDYMLKVNPNKGFYNTIFPQIKVIGTEIVHAAFPFIDPQRKVNNFQIFGIDIMIDQDYKCWLIQVNANPCIEVNCKVLAFVIPSMLDNALTISLDTIITAPFGKLKTNSNNYVEHNKFQLIFDQQTQGFEMLKNYRSQNLQIGNYGDDDDQYQSCNEQDYND